MAGSHSGVRVGGVGIMWRNLRWLWVAGLGAGLFGCATGPLLDNPVRVAILNPTVAVANPVYLPQGPEYYGKVYEKVLDVLDDYFVISVENRYDGRIETFPRIAPGVLEFWKDGSPDLDERLEATVQTIRHRAVVLIQAADDGGFFVQVTVYKELEDLPRPTRSTVGAAVFRSDHTVERQYEVIDPTVFESSWIPRGRDTAFEQLILERIKECL